MSEVGMVILVVCGIGFAALVLMLWAYRQRRPFAAARTEHEPAASRPVAERRPAVRNHVRLPFHLCTSEQAKIAGAALGGLTAPLVFIGMMKLAVPADATSDQVAMFAGLVSTAIGSWGTFLVVLLTVLFGGKPDPKVRDATARAAALVANYPSDNRREVASAVAGMGP